MSLRKRNRNKLSDEKTTHDETHSSSSLVDGGRDHELGDGEEQEGDGEEEEDEEESDGRLEGSARMRSDEE